MLALQTAIQSAFTASADLAAAFPGGLWTGIAPAGTAMPYAVMTTVAAPRSATYGGGWTEPRLQFAAFGVDHDAAGAAMGTLTGLLDGALLTLAAGQLFDALRLDEPTDAAMPPGGDGRTAWRWLTTYRFAVREP